MDRAKRKVRIGRVVSDKMNKTRVVAVEQMTRHPLYGKTMRRTRKYKFHDEDNVSRTGDLVQIVETRPLSKDKRWCLLKVMEKTKL